MKLKKLSIQNLRGLQSIEFDNQSLTTLIGKNNCGKSSVLRAIELLCTGVKPDLEEFYLRSDESIVIQGVFGELRDWERNSPAISGLIYNNQLELRYVASIIAEEGEKKKIEVEYYAYRQNEEIQGWSEKWTDLDEEIKAIAGEVDIKNGKDFTSKSNKEKVKQRIRESHPAKIVQTAAEWSNDSIAFNNSLQQALPKIIVIPAVKDATDESKYSKTGKGVHLEN